jgi:hypothetical protein
MKKRSELGREKEGLVMECRQRFRLADEEISSDEHVTPARLSRFVSPVSAIAIEQSGFALFLKTENPALPQPFKARENQVAMACEKCLQEKVR